MGSLVPPNQENIANPGSEVASANRPISLEIVISVIF
jgi:hypothetical protein